MSRHRGFGVRLAAPARIGFVCAFLVSVAASSATAYIPDLITLHEMPTAIRLANEYAWNYGYYAIAIDLESSHLWQEEWGALTKLEAL